MRGTDSFPVPALWHRANHRKWDRTVHKAEPADNREPITLSVRASANAKPPLIWLSHSLSLARESLLLPSPSPRLQLSFLVAACAAPFACVLDHSVNDFVLGALSAQNGVQSAMRIALGWIAGLHARSRGWIQTEELPAGSQLFLRIAAHAHNGIQV